jgi:hypothetical protein
MVKRLVAAAAGTSWRAKTTLVHAFDGYPFRSYFIEQELEKLNIR